MVEIASQDNGNGMFVFVYLYASSLEKQKYYNEKTVFIVLLDGSVL